MRLLLKIVLAIVVLVDILAIVFYIYSRFVTIGYKSISQHDITYLSFLNILIFGIFYLTQVNQNNSK